MATFFDSKQEVIDFQITPHGKRLLSKGKFKPTYYSFSDEGILYDSQYASISTEQNDIESRIQEETPVLKISPLSYGVERDIKEKANIEEKLLIDKLSVLSNSGVGFDYAPSWSVTLLKNTIIDTQPYYTSSDGFYIRIPQVNISCSYKEEIRLDKFYLQASQSYAMGMADFNDNINDSTSFEISPLSGLSAENISVISLQDESEASGKNSTFITSRHFEDGTIYTIEEDEIVIDLTQLNVGMEEEYEIEVYKYELDKNGNQLIVPLDFKFKENNNIIDDILLDQEDTYKVIELDKNKVEYFIDINTDRQIDQRIICKYIGPMTKGKGINNNLTCKNTPIKNKTGKLYNNNIVGSDVTAIVDEQGNTTLQDNQSVASISNKVIC